METPITIKLYYGHFLCHVFHQDYIVRKGNDCLALEHEMWKLLDARGAEYRRSKQKNGGGNEPSPERA